MNDWIGFNPQAGQDAAAKSGQWNVAVATRALAEAFREFSAAYIRHRELPDQFNVRRRCEIQIKGGAKFTGTFVRVDCGYLILRLDDGDRQAAIRIEEIASVVEMVERVGE